jgi:hypothetical protein
MFLGGCDGPFTFTRILRHAYEHNHAAGQPVGGPLLLNTHARSGRRTPGAGRPDNPVAVPSKPRSKPSTTRSSRHASSPTRGLSESGYLPWLCSEMIGPLLAQCRSIPAIRLRREHRMFLRARGFPGLTYIGRALSLTRLTRQYMRYPGPLPGSHLFGRDCRPTFLPHNCGSAAAVGPDGW